ncbi:Ribosomal protein/NADH dehydrogenase domain [Fusarium oxysporum f. sp. vasinfectum]|nr:Ribosomal protein/NADH dehydrogenase domain [Fusarium oxysporum f. sp. vasinfectum]
MTVKAIRQIAKGQNGLGAFILQCKKLDFYYCDWAGSSKVASSSLFSPSSPPPTLKSNSPSPPRPGKHPVVVGHYINGRTKPICVRNLSPYEILQKAELLRDASGEKLKRYNKAVNSAQPSVRGVWSPYHGKGMVV